MAKGPMQSVIHHIRGLVVAQDAAGLADSVLGSGGKMVYHFPC